MPQGPGGSSGRSSGRASHLSLVPSNIEAHAGTLRPNHDFLSVALELADQAIEGLALERRAYASLLALLYEGVASGMPYDLLLDFGRTKAAELRRGDGWTLPTSQEPGSGS